MTLKISNNIIQIRIVSTDKQKKLHRCQVIGRNGKAKSRTFDWFTFDVLRKMNPHIPMGR